jgi:hypothetical protein
MVGRFLAEALQRPPEQAARRGTVTELAMVLAQAFKGRMLCDLLLAGPAFLPYNRTVFGIVEGQIADAALQLDNAFRSRMFLF